MREQILKILEQNARIDMKELAARLGLEEIDVLNEIAAMEAEGVICGYYTMINWEKTAIEPLSALIEVRVRPESDHGFEGIAERIYNYPEVTACYLISGDYDLLVTIEGSSPREISNFVAEKLSPLESVLGTATHFILRKYKANGHIMMRKKKSERMSISP